MILLAEQRSQPFLDIRVGKWEVGIGPLPKMIPLHFIILLPFFNRSSLVLLYHVRVQSACGTSASASAFLTPTMGGFKPCKDPVLQCTVLS